MQNIAKLYASILKITEEEVPLITMAGCCTVVLVYLLNYLVCLRQRGRYVDGTCVYVRMWSVCGRYVCVCTYVVGMWTVRVCMYVCGRYVFCFLIGIWSVYTYMYISYTYVIDNVVGL